MPVSLKKILRWSFVLTTIYIIATVTLALSVFYSGINYQLDNDETYHAQIVYLLSQKYQPYKDFLLIYTPVFHWFLLPVFTYFGYIFQTFTIIRFVMLFLFVGRLFFTFLTIKKIHSKLAGFLFIPITLLDAMTVFSSMQIRPDTLMIFLLSFGSYLFTLAVLHDKKRNYFTSGLILSLAVVTLSKALPIVFVGFVVGIFYTMWSKKYSQTLYFILGGLLPLIVFAGYLLETRTFLAMTQLQIDSISIFNHLLFGPQTIFAYVPNNFYLYGIPDKPLNWYYQWILPLLGGGGLVIFLSSALSDKKISGKTVMAWFFSLSTIAAWISLLYIPSTFIQYHLPVNWLFAISGACGISSLLQLAKHNNWRYNISIISLTCVYLLFLETNIRANMFRGTISGVEVKQGIEQVWQTIPTDAFVFPVLLFRKPPHAVFAGWADLPQNIIQRYPPPDQVLEQKQVEFVFYNDYQKNYFPPETREYIEANYEPTHLPDLLRRKKV